MNVGDRHTRWTVIDVTDHGDGKVGCRCDCGTERRVWRHKLTSTDQQSKSCGCLKVEQMREQSAPDFELTYDTTVQPGSRHGRWTAQTLPYAEPDRRDRVVQVRCDCGTQKTLVAHSLPRNPQGKGSKSCGCYNRDLKRAMRLQGA